MKKLMLVWLVIFALMLGGSKILAEENDYSTEEINASVIRRQLKESFQLIDAVTDTGARLSLLINLLTAQAGIDQNEKNRTSNRKSSFFSSDYYKSIMIFYLSVL